MASTRVVGLTGTEEGEEHFTAVGIEELGGDEEGGIGGGWGDVDEVMALRRESGYSAFEGTGTGWGWIDNSLKWR